MDLIIPALIVAAGYVGAAVVYTRNRTMPIDPAFQSIADRLDALPAAVAAKNNAAAAQVPALEAQVADLTTKLADAETAKTDTVAALEPKVAAIEAAVA